MNRLLFVTLLTVFIGLNLLVLRDEGHAQSKVIFIGEGDVTPEKLISVLKPATEGMTSAMGKASCKEYQTQLSEGTPPASESSQAAIQVLFTFDSAKLGPNSNRVLAKLADALNSDALASYCFEIQGHTDDVGKAEYNLELSKRRAQSVVTYLVKKGGVKEQRLLAMGYGEADPIADNSTDIGRARNRRVQIKNLGPAR